jgi:hypothetical protein
LALGTGRACRALRAGCAGCARCTAITRLTGILIITCKSWRRGHEGRH